MDADDRFHVTFVCTGNLCRSPMAEKIFAEHLAADLVVAMTTTHERALAQLGVPSDRRVLLRSFDPDADDDSVPDPYYDSLDEFEQVREQIEAAVPGLLERVRQQ
ncbi:hypothetical protein MX572_13975 [Rhodococcus pyridinivorans]|uniref:arsenate reductase/protein-tyrosine-phosphatase family protein n=1 Tax=Rhodococcus pyridinivorans TaxID=103816 RepID=UPI0020C61A30|nr:hypothetical protein [Rhodococcus pyridinivorans]UTM35678.1 hypothetical protein MX572_13975 [Rhodococcus pyridinivorans]